MGKLTRQYDWAKTSLGPPDQWSLSLRTLIQMVLTSRFPMLIFWGSELITFYNDAFRPSLGNNGKHPSSLGQRGEQSWAESWPVIGPMIYAVMAGGDAVWFEDQKLPLYRDGQMGYAYWTYSFSPVTDDAGAVNGILVTCSETTTAVEQRQKLADSNDQLAFAIEATELGAWDLDPLTNTFTANARLKEWFGLEPDEQVELSLAIAVIVDADRDRVAAAITHTLQYESGGRYDTEFTIIHPRTRQERIVRAKGRAWFNQEQIAYRFNGTLQDITAGRKAQQAQEAAQQLADLAIKSAGIGLFQIDLTTNRMDYSPAYAAIITGDSAYRGHTRYDFARYVHPDSRSLQEANTRTGEESGTVSYQTRVVWDDGSMHHVDVMGAVIRDEKGQPVTYSGTVRDSTESVNQRQALQVSETRLASAQRRSDQQFRALVEEAPVATCLFVGPAMRIEVANEVMLGYWGKDRRAIGQPLAEAVPELKGQSFLAILDEVFTTGKTYEAKNVRAELEVDGVLGTYYFDFTYKPLRNAAGDVYAIMGIAVDVTEQVINRRKLEESEARYRALSTELEQQVQARTRQLQDSIRDLERSNQNLQQFAYVASHDLQEPLRKIRSFGDLLVSQYADQLGSGIDHLQRMQTAASRMSTLIRDLLTFSRISTRQEATASVSLTQVVQQVVTDLDLLIQDTRAVVRIDPLPTVSGDASQLGQLFQNLLSNALKFRRSNTTPLVTVRSQVIANVDLPASIKPVRPVATYHRIDVTDNGIGFDPKYLDRIFQVFQRLHSKSEFAGTGIGLAICEKVAANHGGAITASSQPGEGATFSVFLPA